MTTELTWLKKRVASELNRDKRVSLVEWGHPELSIKKQAELLSLNRSSLYYQPVPPSPEEIAIKQKAAAPLPREAPAAFITAVAAKVRL
ncbi:Uncharacterized [Moorella glycerini]|uniref:Uncharacterized protein n=1 Tax=Neomoorella stamsii TaxID=1266720 RepID=A0A9X7P6M3_9FIRM|nr:MULTISPECIES: hypothetical protein [Moorella]PRR74027.1 hypothetical protein MOST_11680 [Moorella stamsii]CEP66843.1 Uncharacterized [Moorella glycerini]